MQATIKRIDKALERGIREFARQEHLSLNQAILQLLRKGASLDQSAALGEKVGNALDRFFGTWSGKEADQMRKVEEDFEGIDERMWR